MFYDIFTNLCREKGYSPTSLLQKLNISTSKLTAWKNGSMPNSSFLIPISEHLGVSIDYLLTGKEKSSPTEQLTADEQRLLTYYKKLSDIDKGIIIGRAEAMVENQHNMDTNLTTNKNEPCIAKATVYSRSTNNMPPRVETGDFSDILNAPDATDEY